jgi:hypothetical protein
MTKATNNFGSLLNMGVVVGNVDDNAQHQKSRCESVVVLGTARGGTSMVSGALHHLGVFMGDHAKAPVYEDVALGEAIEKRREEDIRRIVDVYSSKHHLWGFKRPSAVYHLPDIASYFPAPKYIFVFKDILSIANRNRISMGLDVLAGLERALSDYARLVDFLGTVACPYILISYDKALSNPEQFIDALTKFLHLEPSEDQRVQALNFISPDPKEYIDKSRITKAIGTLDIVKQTSASGWAKYVYRREPATVVLFINGKEVKRTVANLYRSDLKEKGVHPSGCCAFYFDFIESPVHPNDEIRVKVVDEIIDLRNSPMRVSR